MKVSTDHITVERRANDAIRVTLHDDRTDHHIATVNFERWEAETLVGMLNFALGLR